MVIFPVLSSSARLGSGADRIVGLRERILAGNDFRLMTVKARGSYTAEQP
jgi:hypothetical protein